MYELKTNTAARIAVGPLVDQGDGKTAETGLTVTDLSVQLYQIKTDGTAVVRAQFAPTASGGNNDMALVTDSTDGMYDLELTAAQLNFLGNARITLYDVDGFLVHWIDLQIVSAGYFDWKYGSTIPDVNVTQISGDSTAADNCELMFDGTGYAGGTARLKVDVDTIKTQAVTCAAGVTVLASVGTAATSTAQTGDAYAVVNHVTYGNAAIKTQLADIHDTDLPAVKTDTAAILVDTNELQTDWHDGGRLDLILDARASQTSVTTIDGIVDAILVDTGTDIPATIATIAGYLDTEIASIVSTLGAAGAGLTAIPWNAAWDAEVQSECTNALNAYDPPTNAEVTARTLAAADYATAASQTTIAGYVDSLETRLTAARAGYLDNLASAPPAASAIADAVWDEALAGHAGAGSAGAALSAAGTAGDPWSTALPGSYAEGTAGEILGGLSVSTASAIADAVLEEGLAAHTAVSGSLAEALNDIRNRSCGKLVIDRDAGTIAVYDADAATLLYTLTMVTVDDVDTITRS